MTARLPHAQRIATYAPSRMGRLPKLVDIQLGKWRCACAAGLMPPTPDNDDGWMAAAILDSRVFLDVGCNCGF
jgi:hypothetical protein